MFSLKKHVDINKNVECLLNLNVTECMKMLGTLKRPKHLCVSQMNKG
jgi:hypothetical protein